MAKQLHNRTLNQPFRVYTPPATGNLPKEDYTNQKLKGDPSMKHRNPETPAYTPKGDKATPTNKQKKSWVPKGKKAFTASEMKKKDKETLILSAAVKVGMLEDKEYSRADAEAFIASVYNEGDPKDIKKLFKEVGDQINSTLEDEVKGKKPKKDKKKDK